MDDPSYYRGQAARARRLAHSVIDRERAKGILSQVAQEYDWPRILKPGLASPGIAS
jgi:hypothetical protein